MMRVGTVVRAGALAACTVTALALPAQAAAPTYRVAVGKATTGTALLAGKLSGGNYTLFNVSAGVSPVSCPSSTLAGTAALSPAAPAAGLLQLTSGRQGGCVTRGGTPLTVTQRGTWNVNAVGKTSSGVTTLVVTKINLRVVGAKGACSYTLTGSADATYSNSGTLAFTFATRRLVASHVLTGTGACEAGDGNQFTLLASSTVRSTQPAGRLKITNG